MLKAVLSTYLLLTPLSSALYIYCNSASNDTGTEADGNAETLCNAAANSCTSNVLTTNIGKPEEQAEKTCLKDRFCFTGDYSFTAADGKFFEMKGRCCKTRMCNKATLRLPGRNMRKENGLQCPACFSYGETMCQSVKTINCTENETQCVNFRGALSKALYFAYKFTFKGCGTTDFCAIPKNKRIGSRKFVITPYEASCYNASPI